MQLATLILSALNFIGLLLIFGAALKQNEDEGNV